MSSRGILLVIIAICGIGYFSYNWLNQWIDRREFNRSIQREIVKFDPENVVEFHWETPEQKFHFRTGTQVWNEKNNKRGREERLQFLSQMTYKPVSYDKYSHLKENPKIVLRLRAAKEVMWEGHWGNNWFVWTKGPIMGMGIDLSAHLSLSQYFYEGRFAFSDRSFNWCPQFIQKVVGSLGEKEIDIRFDGRSWLLNGQNRDLQEWIRKWQIYNCQLQVEYFFDPNMIQLDWEIVGQVNLTFNRGSSKRIILYKNNLISIRSLGRPDTYFFSQSFKEGLLSL